MPTFVPLLIIAASSALSADELINPVPRPALVLNQTKWDFENGVAGWAAENRCRLSAEGGVLKVQALGYDPFFHCPVDLAGGQIRLRIKLAGKAAAHGASSGPPATRHAAKIRPFTSH